MVQTFSQIQLILQHEKEVELFEKNSIDTLFEHKDSLSLIAYLDDLTRQLHYQNYFEAAVDSFSFKEDTAFVQLHIGKVYQGISLENGNIPSEIIQNLHLERFFSSILQWNDIEEVQETLLTYAENNAYPFAEIWIDSLSTDSNTLLATLFWKTNEEVLFEGIEIIGDADIHPDFLSQFLGLLPGTAYRKKNILAISQQIRNLPYLQEKQTAKVRFKDDKASVYLFLEPKNVSRFDILIGVQPDNRLAAGTRRTIITGNGLIDLVNTIGRGERLQLELQQIRPQTQELKAHFEYPYILNLPIGISTDFNLFKNDSTNLLVEYELGIEYLINGEHSVQFFFKNQSSRLLSINEMSIIQQKRLPSNLDTRQRQFGVEHSIWRLDNRFNPRRGWSSVLRASVGEKTIIQNNTILELEDENQSDFDFATLYEELDENSVQYQLEGKGQFFLPFGKRNTIKFQSQNGIIFNNQPLFNNELFRLGGYQTQRGFDEQAFLSSWYHINTLEYRWLFDANSNLFAFVDVGYLEQKTASTFQIQQPLGLGVGLQLATEAGTFGINAALGRDIRNENDFFDFRNPKIHFGYISVF